MAYLAGVSHELIRAPLADRAAVAAAVDGVDAIVQLAARAGIPDSVADPIGTFEVNVAQTLGLLDAARQAGVRRFVFASSNAAAGDHEPPADERDLPHPRSPYGASKLAGEAYCQAYAATYGIAACALRFSNAYGPYSLHKKSVVAAWLRAASCLISRRRPTATPIAVTSWLIVVSRPVPTWNSSPATASSGASSVATTARARSPLYTKSRVCSPSPWIVTGSSRKAARSQAATTLFLCSEYGPYAFENRRAHAAIP